MSILAGKAVIITGSGRGIGAACAHAVSRLGGAVVVNDLDAERAETVASEIVSNGGRAIPHAGDISDWSQAERLIAQCAEVFGRVDGLVNNAAVFQVATLDHGDEAMWRSALSVNVLGTAFCTVHALRVMKRQGSGSIVNVTSGAHQGLADMAAYGASKGAVASLTYCGAVETFGTGIRINAISPRATTEMAATMAKFAGRAPVAPDAPLPFPPELNAPAICYLLSDDSRHVNGQIIRIEGNALSLVSHPAVIATKTSTTRWDETSVRDAFREHFADHLQPLGIVQGSVTFADRAGHS